jgi:hypothetical protein
MTEAERDAIATPATGLTIFQTDGTPGYYYFDGAIWKAVGSADGHWILSGGDILNTNPGNVAVNAFGAPPDPSAILDVQSTTKGFLAPRMTEAERDVLDAPATGLTIFQTDGIVGYYYFNGASWTPVDSGGGGGGGHWTANGTDIYNNNAGNVGIGVTAPLSPLHVHGDFEAMRLSGISPYIQFYNELNEPKGWIWQGPGSNMSIGTNIANTSGRLEMYNAGNLNMAVHSFGGVDIWGTSPALTLRNSASTVFGNIYKNDNDLEIAARRPGLVFSTPGNLILQTSILSEFSNQYAGNVGIGTRTPATKLHLVSDLEALRIEGVGYTFLSFYNGDSYKGFLLSDQNNSGLGTSGSNLSGILWFYV